MLKSLIKILLYLCAFVSVIMFLPGSILLDIKPKSFYHPLPKTFEKQNDLLSGTIKLFEDQISGPESLAIFDGKVVTGAADGYIYQIDGNNLKPLVKLAGTDCDNEPWNSTNCGRPLGMKFNSKGVLYIVEPDLGVFTVEDIFKNSPKVSLVMSIKVTESLGKSSKFLNDLTIAEGEGLNGGDVLYISDVSTKFSLVECMLIIGGSDTGRIIKYDINAKTIEIIADKLLFPNGLEITDDKNAILFCEFVARQVFKYYIRGPKKGQTELFITALPGEPDNIRRSANNLETYWIGLTTARIVTKPNEFDYYLKKPLLRKLVCRLFHLFGNAIESLGYVFDNSFLKEYGFNIKTALVALPLLTTSDVGSVVEVDKTGQIVNALQAPDNAIALVSEVREVRINDKETVLYLGSFFNNFIGKLTLKR